ncbi:MAG TPA: hypothetical protein PKA66_00645 [Gemmatimonadales bacterium]|nr:hypothetical protein [Gemmatimonadales bacterium]
MSIRNALLSAALLTLPAVALSQTPAPPASASTSATATAEPAPTVHPRVGNEMELGRQFTALLYTAQFDSLFAHMSEEMRTDMGSPDDMAAQWDQFAARIGEETKLVDEMVVMRNGSPQYWRTADFSMAPEPVMIRWVIVDGEIRGIGINPASQAPPIDPNQD